MDLLNEYIDYALRYLKVGLDFVFEWVFSVEGIIMLIFATFLFALISAVKS